MARLSHSLTAGFAWVFDTSPVHKSVAPLLADTVDTLTPECSSSSQGWSSVLIRRCFWPVLWLWQDWHPSSEVGKKGFHIHLRFILSLPEVIYTQRIENYGSKLWSKTPFCEISTFEELHIYLTSGSIHIQNSGSKLESKSLILFMNRRREIIWCWHTPVSLQFFQKTYYCSNVWY
jgi:hypothetical protein